VKPIRVVLVDDNASFRRRLAGLLRLHGDLEIAGEAADGTEALARVRELRPDVILMDFRMPGGDGFTVGRTIAREFPQVKIFILTAYPGALDAAQLSAQGLEGLLIKNQPVTEIAEAIRKSARA
jgi:DNA-binding NarL/FixJ family response regulator